MSAFSPEILPPLSADRPHTVARFLPTALRRVPAVAKVWGVGKLVVFGGLTLGFYPCHALQTRVRETIAMHAQQLELAAGWFAARLPADDADVLTAAAAKLRPGAALARVGTALLAAAFVITVAHFVTRPPGHGGSWATLFVPMTPLSALSVGLLSLAYLLAVLRMNLQVVAAQQFALAFNAVHEARPMAVPLPPMVWGVRVFYLLAGVLMAAVGMLWALPMMLAWAVLKDFSESSVRGLRVALGERITSVSGVEPVVGPAALCANPDCRLVSPPEATFCPRCGRSTRPAA